MKRSLFCIGFAFVVLLFLLVPSVDDSRVAHAAQPIRPCQEVTVDNLIATCSMQIHHSKPITLRVKSPIVETNAPPRWKVVDEVKRTGDTIVFETSPQAKAEQISGIYVVHTREYTLYIVVSAALTADVADHAIVLDHAGQLAIFDSAVSAKAREIAASMIAEIRQTYADELRQNNAQHAEELARLEARIEELQQYVLDVANHAIIGAVIQGNRVTPIHQGLDQSEGFSILGIDWVEVGTDRILRFDIYNHNNDPFPVTRVQVFNENGSKEHTGTVRLGGDSTKMAPPKDGPLGVMEPKQRISGAVLISEHQSLGQSIKLMVHGPEGVAPQIRIIPIDPVEPTPEEKQDRQTMLDISRYECVLLSGTATTNQNAIRIQRAGDHE